MFIYGTPYPELKLDFITEILDVCEHFVCPIVLGSDFNLVRDDKDKNNGVINQ